MERKSIETIFSSNAYAAAVTVIFGCPIPDRALRVARGCVETVASRDVPEKATFTRTDGEIIWGEGSPSIIECQNINSSSYHSPYTRDNSNLG